MQRKLNVKTGEYYRSSPYDSVWKLIQNKKYTRALNSLITIKRIEKFNDDYWIAFARCAFELRNKSPIPVTLLKIENQRKVKLVELSANSLKHVYNKKRHDYLLLLIRCFQELKEFDLALKALNKLYENYPYSKTIMFLTARLYQAMDDYESALNVYNHWLNHYPYDAQIEWSLKICLKEQAFKASKAFKKEHKSHFVTSAANVKKKEKKQSAEFLYLGNNSLVFFAYRESIYQAYVKRNPRYAEASEYTEVKEAVSLRVRALI